MKYQNSASRCNHLTPLRFKRLTGTTQTLSHGARCAQSLTSQHTGEIFWTASMSTIYVTPPSELLRRQWRGNTRQSLPIHDHNANSWTRQDNDISLDGARRRNTPHSLRVAVELWYNIRNHDSPPEPSVSWAWNYGGAIRYTVRHAGSKSDVAT